MLINRFCLLTLHDGDRYHIETSPLICSSNQWTGFYMITAYVLKELSNPPPPPQFLTDNIKIVKGAVNN